MKAALIALLALMMSLPSLAATSTVKKPDTNKVRTHARVIPYPLAPLVDGLIGDDWLMDPGVTTSAPTTSQGDLGGDGPYNIILGGSKQEILPELMPGTGDVVKRQKAQDLVRAMLSVRMGSPLAPATHEDVWQYSVSQCVFEQSGWDVAIISVFEAGNATTENQFKAIEMSLRANLLAQICGLRLDLEDAGIIFDRDDFGPVRYPPAP